MATDLVTPAEYKAYAGISSDNQDDIITVLIPVASQVFKSLCSRSFVDYVDEPLVEIFSGRNRNKLLLSEYPIINILGVEVSDDYGNTYTDLTEFTDYALDLEDGSIINTSYPGAVFTNRINGYRVTYTAGYEKIPSDLKGGVCDLITYYMKNDAAVHSVRAPGSNQIPIDFVQKINFPANIQRIIDYYNASWD